jgi:hypothetical protein
VRFPSPIPRAAASTLRNCRQEVVSPRQIRIVWCVLSRGVGRQFQATRRGCSGCIQRRSVACSRRIGSWLPRTALRWRTYKGPRGPYPGEHPRPPGVQGWWRASQRLCCCPLRRRSGTTERKTVLRVAHGVSPSIIHCGVLCLWDGLGPFWSCTHRSRRVPGQGVSGSSVRSSGREPNRCCTRIMDQMSMGCAM